MRRPRDLLSVLLVAQLAALAVVAVATVARFQLFAEVDEAAHYAFVQEVAEEGRLPVLGRDLVSPQLQAIVDGTWPQPSPRPVQELPFGGQSYEAFQPPLYYVLAAPAFAVRADHRDKVFALRAFGALLLALTVVLVQRLAVAVFAGRWRLPFALALSVLLWPGVVARAVTVSNSALELPLATAFLLATWTAHRRRSPRAFVVAGALLGACLLTKLTLAVLAPVLLAPAVALLRDRPARARRTAIAAVAAGLALPAVLLAPWLLANLARYDALTPNALARSMQEPVINPIGERYGLDELRRETPKLLKAVLPQEWWREYRGWRATALLLPPIALLLLPAVALIRRPRSVRAPEALILGAPLALGVALIVWTLLVENWAIFLPRYLNPLLPGFALFAAWAWRRASTRDGPLVAVTAVSTAIALGAWAYFALAYFFTDVGASLGVQRVP